MDERKVSSAPALARLRAEAETFTPRTRQRGRSYADRGRVPGLRVDESGIDADVLGSEAYEVRWELVDDESVAT